MWNDPERAQALGQERAALQLVVVTVDELGSGLTDAEDLLTLAEEEDDNDTVEEVVRRPVAACSSHGSKTGT